MYRKKPSEDATPVGGANMHQGQPYNLRRYLQRALLVVFAVFSLSMVRRPPMPVGLSRNENVEEAGKKEENVCDHWVDYTLDGAVRGRFGKEPRDKPGPLWMWPLENGSYGKQIPKSSPPKADQPMLCAPEKNGNRQFGALMYAMIAGEAPANLNQLLATSNRRRQRKWNQQSLGSVDVYFVARNPYTRILSLYLNKVQGACFGKNRDCRTNYLGFNTSTTFPEFVKGVFDINSQKFSNGGWGCVEPHLCPQFRSCVITVPGARSIFVLKLEEQSAWFPCLVQKVGLDERILFGPQWQGINQMDCYYTPTGNCSDQLRLIPPEQVGVSTGSSHATGASRDSIVTEHYDKETAALVSEMYADDFDVLGYSKWDGESPMKAA